MRPRNIPLERELTDIAARAVGLSPAVAQTLCRYADGRAMPGPVRVRDMDAEAFPEIGDARNYLVWGIEPIYADFLTGDPTASADFARRMQALGHVAQAFQALRTRQA